MPENRCLTTDELRRLLDGHVTGQDDDPHILMHLESCANCREALDRIAGSGPTRHCSDEIRAAYEFYQSAMRGVCNAATGKFEKQETTASVSRFLRDIGATEVNGPGSSAAGTLGRIGNVELEHVLGRGGMGIVFKGRDSILDRPVAVKIISPSLSRNALARQRFLQEARLAASINHPNVVKIHAVDDSGTTPALIMEFVDGQPVHDLDCEQTPVAESTLRRRARQIAEGMSAAHAKNIIHRDIKPGNLLLEKGTDQIKIADFGLAFATERTSYMTSDGVVLGTPEYMSPEQVRGHPLDARSDLFSLGAVLYQWCTCRLPFTGQSAMSIAYNIANEPIIPIRQINPDISKEFSELVERLLCKATEDRFQSADAVINALDANGRKSFAASSFRVAAIAGMALVVFAIVFGTIIYIANRDGTDSTVDSTNHTIQIAGRDTSFEDLSAALDAARPGDTILLQGVDSFHLGSRDISTRPLTIRGNTDNRAKVILEEPRDADTWITLTGDLTLENIDLEIPSQNKAGRDRRKSAVAISNSGKLYLLNCRLVATGFIGAVFLSGGSLQVQDSSLFAVEGIGIASNSIGKNKLVIDNGLLVGRSAMVWSFDSRSDLGDEKITITNSTIRSDTIHKLQQAARGNSRFQNALPLSIHSTQTVFSGDNLIEIRQLARLGGNARRIAFSDFVDNSIDWSGKENLYGNDIQFFRSNISEMDVDPQTLAEWNEFWKDREQRSTQDQLKFVGPSESINEQDHVLKGVAPVDGSKRRIGFNPSSHTK